MRWLRLILALFRARFRKKLELSETSRLVFHVWLTDIDASFMNHATLLTVFECGRLDFTVRTGFFRLARERKWLFPLSSISVQFIRPLRAFQKAEVTTRILHIAEHYIYMEQKISRNGKDVAICLAKTKVKAGREDVGTPEILKYLDSKSVPAGAGDLIDMIEKQEQLIKNQLSPDSRTPQGYDGKITTGDLH